jgi:Membrane-bound metallopeptidase
MSDGHFSFASLISSRDEYEESFWPSFTDIMMVITMIFLIVTVAVVLTNTRLLDNLRNSVLAEQAAQLEAQKSAFEAQRAAQEAQRAAFEAQKATEQAEFQLKANATLEEQLEYLQQRSASLEMELLRSRAEAEEARTNSTSKDAELVRLQAVSREQADTLGLRDKAIVELQTNLNARSTQITGLQTKVDESEKKLLSLQGEYTELDKKYQKLLKPARSAKGKQVAEVVYSKNGYSIRKPGEAASRSVTRAALESELTGLKAQYGTELYVKVIIPDNSGLSYNEAWRFTNDMLTKYDYYTSP